MTHYYAELFAGAGGLSRGLEAAGFHALAHAEIEPHAQAVLRHRWPDTRLDGDVTQVNGADYAGVTLLSGGSPCQDLSVAGKRAGLGGSRSSLFYEQVRIWHESQAPYLLWENVYGALSSNAGKDFAAVLSALVGADVDVPVVGRGKSAKPKWQRAGVASGPAGVAAWRVLDLQHFGPPQRRVRVFVLAARAGGVDPAEVLALREGVCGHPSPREQAREGATGGAAGGAGTGGVMAFAVRGREGGGMDEVSTEVPSLRTPGGGSSHAHVVAFNCKQDGTPNDADVSPTLTAMQHAESHTNGGGQMSVVAFGAQNSAAQGASVSVSVSPTLDKSKVPGVVCTTGDITHVLTHEGADASEDGTGRGTPIVVGNSGMESWRQTDTAITLAARDAKGTNNVVVGTLDFGGHGGSYNGQDAYQGRIRAEAGRPRRLTPKECERLMSWPDDWTMYGRKEDGTVYELSDTARYRLCGNGVGSVCVEWIARRLMRALQCNTL